MGYPEKETGIEVNRTAAKNIRDVYKQIYHYEDCNRLMLSEKLGLSRPTINHHLSLLQEAGLIYNTGEKGATGGRKAELFHIVEDARVAMGIDITNTSLSFVVTDLKLNVVDSAKLHLAYEDTPAYYTAFGNQIREMISRIENAGKRFLGIGISLPAIVNEDTNTIEYMTVINGPSDFFDKLQAQTDYPLFLFNDANSAGWSELWARKSKSPLIYLTLNDCIGGAVMMKNVYHGLDWRSGEFGHMTLVRGGRKCFCGKSGCMNAYCSSKNLSDFTGGNLSRFFDELKNKNNPGLRRIFREYLEYLALAISNIRIIFDCDIVLGGEVAFYLKDYLDELKKQVVELNLYVNNGDFIKIGVYEDSPSSVGAALYHIDLFLRNIS